MNKWQLRAFADDRAPKYQFNHFDGVADCDSFFVRCCYCLIWFRCLCFIYFVLCFFFALVDNLFDIDRSSIKVTANHLV